MGSRGSSEKTLELEHEGRTRLCQAGREKPEGMKWCATLSSRWTRREHKSVGSGRTLGPDALRGLYLTWKGGPGPNLKQETKENKSVFYKECSSSIGDDKGEESPEVKRPARELLPSVNLRDVEDHLKGYWVKTETKKWTPEKTKLEVK